MKKKKNRHPRPEEYRIIWSHSTEVTDCVQYYNVYHSSEALADIYHTFAKGKIHAKTIVISAIEEYNRFSNTWGDRMQVCLEHFGNDFDELVEKDCRVELSVSDTEKIILTR
jgi:hypothetical protein